MEPLHSRKTEEIIREIKNLTTSKGYFYVICMILFEDFHVELERIQELDQRKRISTKEAALLLGFMIQKKIDFSTPDNPLDLIRIKQNTYDLLEELHRSFSCRFFERIESLIQKEHKEEQFRNVQKEFFGKGEMLIEPIFYSGTGAYDIQYLDFLECKYKYDKKWLKENKNITIEKARDILARTKQVLQEKSRKVNLYNIRDRLPQIIEDMKKYNTNIDSEKYIKEMLPMLEFHQYVELFFENAADVEKFEIEKIREEGWRSFYKNLIELFIIRKSDFNTSLEIESFLDNFSTCFGDNLNDRFQSVGNYNIINASPIIKLDEERYFVPNTFLLFEAVYESPFYWMLQDKSYRDKLGSNRGKVGEEITFELLVKVFGKHRVFKGVKIKSLETDRSTKKEKDETDIDVLCILGSKALSVQVKSKKLTELSRTGNDEQLQRDFQGAVQDAYDQGVVSRHKILGRNAKYFDENGNEIRLSEEIDEVYIMGITIENYPSLTHQSHILLDIKDFDPYPIVLTIFDLELLVHYLNDPFDFLYYIRQRISLMDYFQADEEIVFLGYHLDQKLCKIPKRDIVAITTDYGQIIDRNYYPLKAGIEVSDDGDVIKNRRKNENFDLLCERLKTLKQAKLTDIIFQLLDLSEASRNNLIELMLETKRHTLTDRKNHNFSMLPDDQNLHRCGFTYLSLSSNEFEELKKKLLFLCRMRKYKSKANIWIGLGSLMSSLEIIDAVAFNDQQWQFDEILEKMAYIVPNGQMKILGDKVGRNDKCPCGSGLKYKNCCGQN